MHSATGLIRPSTAENEGRYVAIVSELIGSKQLRGLTPADVELVLQRLQTGRLKGKHRAIQQAFRCLRKALLDVRPRLESNPCDAVDRPTAPKPDTRTFTHDELRRIREAADTVADETFAALVVFLGHSGARINEALGLTWGDTDFEGKQAHIRKALVKVRGQGICRVEPKTKSAVRSIPLNDVVIERLRDLRGLLGVIPHSTAPVFASERGGALDAPTSCVATGTRCWRT